MVEIEIASALSAAEESGYVFMTGLIKNLDEMILLNTAELEKKQMQLGILKNKLLQFRKDHKGSIQNMEKAMSTYEHIEAICDELKEKIDKMRVEKSELQAKLSIRNMQQPGVAKSVKGPWQTIINANKARKAARAANQVEPGAQGGSDKRSNRRTRANEVSEVSKVSKASDVIADKCSTVLDISRIKIQYNTRSTIPVSY